MITLVDTVTASADRVYNTPGTAFAGYVGGYYADLPAIERDYPNHRFVSIAVNNTEVAEFCDFERFDFNADQVIPWLISMHNKGIWRPGCYGPADALNDILPYIARRLPRQMYRVWGALWNGVRDVPRGWDAHQYQTEPEGRDVDLSVCLDTFFPQVRTLHPKPRPKPEEHPISALVTYENGKWDVRAR